MTDLDRPCGSCGGTAVADPGIDVFDGRTLDAAARLTGDGPTGTGAELRLLAGRPEAAGARVTVSRDR
ncbi:hypothetical protein [Virgisporangium ochraceum]|uniref:Uncharacterized protein n=1 Tax=Virgisporangium ochraceum TaxID=65505 RepID=A0A8J3ZQ99_9ACTN|nr:hypothetical protein [Virgisporangium ochraceum]GIJ67053.1 hypothetical protein Voc01_019700 [Virgisporangium ochraceum]